MIDTRIGPRGRWIRLVVVPVGALALVGLAACGTGTTTSSAATSSSAAAQPSTADDADSDDADSDSDDVDSDMADYRSCLADNGVTMPEPPAGGGAPRQGGTPPSGAPAAGGGQGSPGGSPGQAPPGVDATTWAAAQKACADLAPTPPDGSAPAGSSGN